MMMPSINTTGRAMALGIGLGATPVAAIHVPVFVSDYRNGHQGQPKTIPMAIATMVVGIGGLGGMGTAIRSNTAALRAGAGFQGAGVGFALAGGAAVMGYLLVDSLPHRHAAAAPAPAAAPPAPAPPAPAR